MQLKRDGLYIVKYKDEEELTVGKWDGDGYFPWTIVGSDEVLEAKDITVIKEVAMPKKVPSNTGIVLGNSYQDIWYPDWGVGECVKVLKTRVHIVFSVRGLMVYDSSHYSYLKHIPSLPAQKS